MRTIARLLLGVALVGLAGAVAWRCELADPQLEAPSSLAVGRSPRTVAIGVRDGRAGLREVTAAVRQGDAVKPLAGTQYPGNLAAGGPVAGPVQVELTLDPRALGLAEGEAVLELTARDWSWAGWLGGNRTAASIPLRVDLSPPRVAVETGLSYAARGGTGAVAYSLSEAVARDGVEVAGAFFPGFPHPAGGEGAASGKRRVALFAIARDAPQAPKIQVVAEDDAGNRAAASWPLVFQERRFSEERIDLPARFLEQKVPELAGEVGVAGADPVAVFQEINKRIRAENEGRVREIVAKPSGAPLWRGPFVQWPNSEVTSLFAEHRTYFVEGKQVSEAIHYGYDLATLAGAEVTASNAGSVIFAGPLGIYGNCVVLDHGLGLASLYAHLASIAVGEGDAVAKGQAVGRSGATGLAGGDHLHFAILVGGTYVEPKEWWDPKWVREKVESQLGPSEPAPQQP